MITFGRYELKPGTWPTIAAIAGIALTLALGNWQMGRARYKEALQVRYETLSRQPPVAIGPRVTDPGALSLRRVEVRGTFQPEHMIFLDNRIHNHVPGYHVLMPVRISGSSRDVLVNRGWTPAPRLRSELPEVRTPAGEVMVEGVAVVPSGRYVELSQEVTSGRVWQNLDIGRYREASGLDLHEIVVQQTSVQDDGLVREWSPPDYGRNTHLAYAVQWFALAAAIAIYYLVTHVRRKPKAG